MWVTLITVELSTENDLIVYDTIKNDHVDPIYVTSQTYSVRHHRYVLETCAP